jgi:hypothetical protein
MVWKAVSAWVDEVALTLNRVFEPRAFRGSGDGPPPRLEDLLREQEARAVEVRWPARFERRVGRLRLTMPAIDVETFADFHPARSADADTLFVYHHGLGEIPHDGSARAIFSCGRLAERVDWIAIKGAHHDAPGAVFGKLLYSQESFARSLLSSVFAARALGERLRARYRHVVLGGVSMGGVIALIDAAIGSRFDMHVPLVAGPDLDHVLRRSAFARVVCPKYLKRCSDPAYLDGRLDLIPRLAAGGPPIRAVLARYDRLFHLEPQRAAYARVARAEVEVVSGGHITAMVRFRAVAAVLERWLERDLWSPGRLARAA